MSSDEVAGGRKPTRHRTFVQHAVGVALGGLSLALVFTSGYLLGSTGTPQRSSSAVELSAPAGAALPAPDDGPRRGVDGPNHDRPGNRPDRPDSEPKKSKPKRFVTVEEGDSLWGIAVTIAPRADPQLTVHRIARLNSLNASAGLEIGQRLAVPVSKNDVRRFPKKEARREHRRQKAVSRSTGPVAAPVAVTIPSLGLNQDLIELNVVGGTLQVPSDYDDIGWWRDGPSPGAQGSAVLVGHVDSPTGPAVFYRLSAIQIGDLVTIRRADGTKATFRVREATLYPRRSFPSSSVYRQHGRPTLTLVTCGGTYDAAAEQYTDNLVVTAYLDNGNRQ